ncbi:MAG: hypothetical protein KAH18_02775 [Psychromonas sp.]|nr:hypothetical protein [Psychromonas sp.]
MGIAKFFNDVYHGKYKRKQKPKQKKQIVKPGMIFIKFSPYIDQHNKFNYAQGNRLNDHAPLSADECFTMNQQAILSEAVEATIEFAKIGVDAANSTRPPPKIKGNNVNFIGHHLATDQVGFHQYLKRLALYFGANDIDTQQRVKDGLIKIYEILTTCTLTLTFIDVRPDSSDQYAIMQDLNIATYDATREFNKPAIIIGTTFEIYVGKSMLHIYTTAKDRAKIIYRELMVQILDTEQCDLNERYVSSREECREFAHQSPLQALLNPYVWTYFIESCANDKYKFVEGDVEVAVEAEDYFEDELPNQETDVKVPFF